MILPHPTRMCLILGYEVSRIHSVQVARLSAAAEEDVLGNVPDEFLDPVTFELMTVCMLFHSLHHGPACR